MKVAAAVLAASVGLAALCGCTSRDAKTSCGPTPYTFAVNGHQVEALSTCAGNLPADADHLSMAVGEALRVTGPPSGYDYSYPVPLSTNEHVLANTGHTAKTAVFAAVASGTTQLRVTSPQCPSPAAAGATPSCVLLVITIRGAAQPTS